MITVSIITILLYFGVFDSLEIFALKKSWPFLYIVLNAYAFVFIFVFGNYKNEAWLWDAGLIMGWANEVASAGQKSFIHETNKIFDANYAQNDDLGTELDFGFQYKCPYIERQNLSSCFREDLNYSNEQRPYCMQ